MELKQYWAIVRKRLWLVVLLVLISASAVTIHNQFFVEKQYYASTKLIVNQNQDLSVVNGKLDLGTINSNIQLIKTYKEIIRSPRIMKIVEEQYPELGLTANQLINRVGVSAVDDSQVMNVYSVDYSYPRAAHVVNAVAAVFQKEVPLLMKVDNITILNGADPEANVLPMTGGSSMAMAVILALLAGIGLAFLLDYLDDTIKTESDIAGVLGLATFASVPKVKHSEKTAKKRSRIRSEPNVSFEV